MDSAFGAYALDRNEGFDWTFIPWSFAMWSPFGSRVCSFSIVTKDWLFFLDLHLGLVAFSVSLAEWALVLSYSSLGYVVLRLGGSRVKCSSPPHSLFLLSPLRVRLPEWSVQPFVAIPWGKPISIYSRIGVQFSSCLRRLLV